MTTVHQFHKEAARMGQLAMVARDSNHHERAAELARKGYQLERKALALLPDDETSEPTRSALLLSAASLVYQCGKPIDALRLIKRGLDGSPPPTIRCDLVDLSMEIWVDKGNQELKP